MGRGSPVCQQIREKIIEMFKNNVPQRKIERDLDISPSTVHNIIKRFKDTKMVRVLDWPACSPDLSPIENVWRILKHKMRQQRPHTVAHLKTCLQEEWDRITPETLHHLVSSVPKRLLSVVKRNGNITKW